MPSWGFADEAVGVDDEFAGDGDEESEFAELGDQRTGDGEAASGEVAVGGVVVGHAEPLAERPQAHVEMVSTYVDADMV